jgi:hypothetical protein
MSTLAPRHLTLATLATIGFSLLACAGGGDGATSSEGGGGEGGSEEVTTEDLPEIEITQPWKSMSLPIDDGQVVLSDSTVLLIAYDGASVTSLTNKWPGAVEAAGWRKADDYSTPEFTAIIFTKQGGTQQLGLAVGVEEGVTFVYMEDLDKVPESESTVKRAKSGKRKLDSSKSKKVNSRRHATGKKTRKAKVDGH